MSDAVIIAIVVVVLVLVALAVVLPRVGRRGREGSASPSRRGSAVGARRAGAAPPAEGEGEGEGDAAPAVRVIGPEARAARGDADGADAARPADAPRAPDPAAREEGARARARELQWGEDRDFEWVDTRGTRPPRRFEREPTVNRQPEERT